MTALRSPTTRLTYKWAVSKALATEINGQIKVNSKRLKNKRMLWKWKCKKSKRKKLMSLKETIMTLTSVNGWKNINISKRR